MRMLVGCSICAAILCMLSQTGCNDAPSDVGSSLLPDTIEAKTISTYTTKLITADTTRTSPTFSYNSGKLFIGRTAQSAASTLIRLTNIPDTLASLTEADIQSATILMRPRRYVIGDSIDNTLSFKVFEIAKPWIVADTAGNPEVNVVWSDLHTTSLDNNTAFFPNESVISSFEGKIDFKKDTLDDVRLPLNDVGKKMLAKWFVMQHDTILRKQIHGLGFISTAASKVIREFATQSPSRLDQPLIRIEVLYSKPGSGKTDTLMLASGNDASFVESENLGSTHIYTLPTVTNEGRIHFDISSISPQDAILIAELTLSLDTSKCLAGNFGRERAANLVYLDFQNNVSYSVGGIIDSTTNKVTFRGLQQALDWSRFKQKDSLGKGVFALRSVGVQGEPRLERMAYFSSTAADSTLRPRLTITYTRRPTLGRKP